MVFMSKDNKFGLPRIFRKSEEAEVKEKELKQQKELHELQLKQQKELHEQQMKQQKELHEQQIKSAKDSLKWTRRLAIFTIVLATATIWLAIETGNTAHFTGELAQSQNEIFQREELLEGPYLSIWQSNTTNLAHHKSHFIKSTYESQDIVYIPFCIRNEGKTSTGPISIYSEGSNFTTDILPSYFDNMPSHTGNCTLLGIYYCVKSEDLCKREMPLNNVSIPVYIHCSLCKQQPPKINLTFCIWNKTIDECGNLI